MTMPNFLVIGAAKAGTSALYRYMQQHPQVYLTPKKEPHYFSYDSRTKMTNGPGDTIPHAVTDCIAYQALFDDVSNELAYGEASPTYLYVQGASERILSEVPDVRLIAILRQPVDRAYSAYMHVVRDGRETILDFQEAIQQESNRVEAGWGPIWHYIRGGYYHSQLLSYYDRFPADHIRVVLYDDFRSSPQSVLQSLFAFLGVDEGFVPDMSVRPNVSGVPRSGFVQSVIFRLFMKPNPVRALFRWLLPENTRFRFTTTVRNRNLRRVPLSADLRGKLTRRYYLDDIAGLETLLDRDLSEWLT